MSTNEKLSTRGYRDADFDALKQILVDAFEGVSIDQGMEDQLGLIAGRSWQWRKGRDLEKDIAKDREGIFVATDCDRPIGFISTWCDHEARIGHIPNLVLDKKYRGWGVGRNLIRTANEHFREQGMVGAKIETLVQNERGNGLYTSEGFIEVARQIHFVKKLDVE